MCVHTYTYLGLQGVAGTAEGHWEAADVRLRRRRSGGDRSRTTLATSSIRPELEPHSLRRRFRILCHFRRFLPRRCGKSVKRLAVFVESFPRLCLHFIHLFSIQFLPSLLHLALLPFQMAPAVSATVNPRPSYIYIIHTHLMHSGVLTVCEWWCEGLSMALMAAAAFLEEVLFLWTL